MNVYGLLDSPSVAGAYRFVIDIGDTAARWTSMPRCIRASRSSGSASRRGTSMFFSGKNDHRASRGLAPGDPRLRRPAIWTRQRRMDLAAAE